MLLGRFGYVLPVLAIAGVDRGQAQARAHRRHVAHRRDRCSSACVIGVILIMGGLQYFPAQALGPIVEHFQVLQAVAAAH